MQREERLHKKVAYNTGSLAASTKISPPEGKKSRHQCWQETRDFLKAFRAILEIHKAKAYMRRREYLEKKSSNPAQPFYKRGYGLM